MFIKKWEYIQKKAILKAIEKKKIGKVPIKYTAADLNLFILQD